MNRKLPPSEATSRFSVSDELSFSWWACVFGPAWKMTRSPGGAGVVVESCPEAGLTPGLRSADQDAAEAGDPE